MPIFSRRSLISGVLSLPAGTSAATPEMFGAVGDGRADDSRAMMLMSKWLNAEPHRTVVLKQVYRITETFAAEGTGKIRSGAILIIRPKNVSVIFDGGVILMDCLDLQGRGNQGHGIYVEGPGDGLQLKKPTIRWMKAPTKRSQGDGIRLRGYPTNEGALANINIAYANIEDAPQAGLILIGCKNVFANSVLVQRTKADGVHINASNSVKIVKIEAIDTGDDACAFVNYYLPSVGGIYGDGQSNPYGQPGLGDFANKECRVDEIIAHGGRASGLRLAQSSGVNIGIVRVYNKQQGLISDGGLSGGKFRWSCLQSMNCRVNEIYIENCSIGVFLRQYNDKENKKNDIKFKYSNISIGSISTKGCPNALLVQNLSGFSIGKTVVQDGAINLDNCKIASLGGLTLRNGGKVGRITPDGAYFSDVRRVY